MALQRDLSLTNLILAVGGSLLAWSVGGLMAFLLALVFA